MASVLNKCALFFPVFFLGLAVFVQAQPAHAQCTNTMHYTSDPSGLNPTLAGLPCVVPKTPDLPEITTDGPNDPANYNAQPPRALHDGNPVCDPDVMNRIYAKTYLEATREHIMAETILRKPDSVLEYTCFDQLVNIAGDEAPQLFSETEDWRYLRIDSIDGEIGPVQVRGSCGGLTLVTWAGACPTAPIAHPGPCVAVNSSDASFAPLRCAEVIVNTYMGSGRLMTFLRTLVKFSLRIFIQNNFSHDFLGGQMTGIDYVACDIDYVCNYMNMVWYTSKCNDFNDWEDFYSFETLMDSNTVPVTGFDPRIWPRSCTIPDNLPPLPAAPVPLDPRGTGITRGVIDLANNFDTVGSLDYAYVNFELQDANHLDLLFPDGATLDDGSTVNCAEPVPTGVEVTQLSFTVDALGNVTRDPAVQFNDYICINPGCFYDNIAGECVP